MLTQAAVCVFSQSQMFPLSGDYTGFFKMKEPGGQKRVVDEVNLNLLKNSAGGWNIAGSGKNNIGEYNVVGVLFDKQDVTAQIELFRIYTK
jgi:hypothetical protein